MVQKPLEERGDNGRKHVIIKRWTKHTENPRRGRVGKYNETADMITIRGNRAKSLGKCWKNSESVGKCDNNQRKWCKNHRKMKDTGKTLGKK